MIVNCFYQVCLREILFSAKPHYVGKWGYIISVDNSDVRVTEHTRPGM